MARSPLAPGPADEDVTHGQDVSPEDVEDEASDEEREESHRRSTYSRDDGATWDAS